MPTFRTKTLSISPGLYILNWFAKFELMGVRAPGRQ